MIRLYDRDEMEFNHNETVLTDVISAEVEEEANGLYELILEYPRNDFAKTLSEGKIIQAPTPRGDQLFRIYKPVKNLKTYTVYARHIFYDLLNNFVESAKPTQQSGEAAIRNILSNTQFTQRFVGSSDITDERSAYYVRMNPVQALLGAGNSFVNVWGGELVRDNFSFRVNVRGGFDNDYEVRIGKNLLGVEVDIDESNVYTRVYPSVVIEDNKVTVLPEKYVDSPLIESYEQPRIVEERIDLTDEQKELPIEDIYTLMRNHCTALFEDGVDKPSVNYKVDFIELSKTEQYKHLKVLEKLDIYDDVTTIIPELDIDVKARVMRYKYDALKKRYIKMELGNFKDSLSAQLSKVNKTTNQIYNELDRIENTIQVAANGKNAVHRGPDEPFATAVGDLWYKPVGDGEMEMYQWNGEIWELILDTRNTTKNAEAIADAQEGIEEAKQSADTANQQINDAIQNAGFSSLTDLTLDLQTIANQALTEIESAYTNIGHLTLQDALSAIQSNADAAHQTSLTAGEQASNALIIANEFSSNARETISDIITERGLVNGTWVNTKIDEETGELSHKITQIENIIGQNIRNLVVRSGELADTYINTDGNNSGYANHSLSIKSIKVVPGESLTFQKETTNVDNFWRYRWLSESGQLISRQANQSNQFTLTVPADARFLEVSYPSESQPMITRGTEAKDYVLAPEDNNTQEAFQILQAEYKADLEGLESTLTNIQTNKFNVDDFDVFYQNEYSRTAQRASDSYKMIENDIPGQLITAQTRIDANAEAITRRATKQEFNAVERRVTTSETLISEQADAISLRATRTEAEGYAQSAIDGLVLGNRNYLKHSQTLERSHWSLSGSAQIVASPDTETRRARITGTGYVGQQTDLIGFDFSDTTQSFAVSVWVYSSAPGQTIGLTLSNLNLNFQPQQLSPYVWRRYTWVFKGIGRTVGTFRFNIQGATETNAVLWELPQIEKATKTSDWIPSPTDATENITALSASLSIEADNISSLVSRVTDTETLVNSTKQTADGNVTAISNQNQQLLLIEQSVDGIRTRISDAEGNLNQTTQLATGTQTTVSRWAERDLTNLVPNPTFIDGTSHGWSGISVNTGDSTAPTTFYARQAQRDAYVSGSFVVKQDDVLYLSIHSWTLNSPHDLSIGMRWLDKDKQTVTWSRAATRRPGGKTTINGELTVPSGVAFGQIWVQVNGDSNFQPWYFTNVDVRRAATSAQITMLNNAITATVSNLDGRFAGLRVDLDSIVATVSDVQEDAERTTTLLNQTVSTVESQSTVLATIRTDLDGKATVTAFNTLESTVDGSLQRIGNAEGNITQIEAIVNGLQTTVASKASQSEVTQLANLYNISVKQQVDSIWTVESPFTIGSNLSTRRVDNNTVLQVDVGGNDALTTGNNHRLWQSNLTAGTPYTISFEARKTSGTVPGRVTFGQSDVQTATNGVQASIGSGWGQYGGTYTAINTNTASLFFHVAGRYEIRNLKMYIGGGTSQGQLSVLQDAINLRVSKGDVMSQINIEAGRTLIESERLYLDAESVVFSGKAFIPDAAIENLTADKITAGTIDADNINVINLNVNSLVGNISNFVTSYWNESGSDVRISAGGILSTASNGARMRIQNGVALTETPNGATVGYIGYDQIGTSPRFTVQTTLGSHFQVRQTYRNPNGEIANRETLIMNANETLLDTDNLQLIGGQQRLGFGFKHYITGTDANRLLITGKESLALRANESSIFVISNDGSRNHAGLFANLNMNGSLITNTSDRRLKINIENTQVDSLENIISMRFVKYDRININQHDDIGVIAQDTPSLAMYDSGSDIWLINNSKQIMMNSHAIQQLALATESEFTKLKKRLKELEDEINKLRVG